ncbi:hypothetical protein BJF90_17475 [Pseudonocardia sp. CNS-004]|nr:hypothetical protein BJF90_17475 [Pseudonocardia sp. CNS-004]
MLVHRDRVRLEAADAERLDDADRAGVLHPDPPDVVADQRLGDHAGGLREPAGDDDPVQRGDDGAGAPQVGGEGAAQPGMAARIAVAQLGVGQ